MRALPWERTMTKRWRQRWWNSQIMVFLLSGSVLFALPHVADTRPSRTDHAEAGCAECRAQTIHDGDTLTALCGPLRLKIRLLGIDAPEMGQIPYGEEARAALSQRLRGVFIADIRGSDVYERTLAVLHDTQGDINEWLIRAGYAVVYRGADTPAAYLAAERDAKRHKRGIWRQNGDQQNPRNWRRYHL